MDGRRPVYFPADYSSSAPQQQQQQQQQPLNPNFVSPDSISLLQNLAYSLQFRTPLPTSFPPPNSNYYYPLNPSNFQVHPNLPQFSSQYNPSGIGFHGGNSTFQPPPQVLPQKQKQKEVHGKDDTVVPKAALPQNPNVPMERIDQAVIKARHDFITAKENVSAWKVSQAVLVELNVDSWSSLGFQMQEVPSLYRLIVIEGKINSFIHCFVGVQRITSLHDLEVAICKSEGIGKFEELELGPLVRHPLAVHYFSISSDVTEVFRITAEDVIIFLSEFTTIRREIKLNELLDYIAKKRSVIGKEKLGIRIQSLGMHISCIRDAKRSENITVKKFQDAVPPKSRTRSKIKSRPLFSSLKKKLDVRFGEISERLESFSSDQKKFCGKHIKFRSSSSEKEDTDDNSSSDKNDDDFGHNSNYSIQTSNSSQKGSRCPYPSRMEEMSRLGLKSDRGGPASSSTPSWNNVSVESSSKKRQLDKQEYYMDPPAKALKRDAVEDNLHPINDGKNSRKASDSQLTDHILSSESIGVFISTWKETCSEYTVTEVLEKMLMLYHPRDSTRASRRRNGWKVMFSKDPFIGLLNVAVASIKYGMWDSIYDTFEAIGHHGLTSRCESIDVEPSEKDASVINVYRAHGGIKAEEVIRKLSSYLELDSELQGNAISSTKKLMFLRKLFNCHSWLADEFCVKEFSCLSQGDFFTFLEKHASLLPLELQKLLTDDIYENTPLEVCIPQHILTVLLSQASSSLEKGEIMTKPRISTLVNRQFPLLSLIVTEDSSLEALIETMERYKRSVCSTNVLFSGILFQTCDNNLEENCQKYALENISGSNDSEQNLRIDTATSKDAIKALLRVPMLKDLSLWSHWDIIYAPSLGPLLGWLLKDVNAKDLLCLVTADSKVIRLDNSATIDSYLEAAVRGLPFETAVQLLSLFALAGGESHFPASLLKCHAQRAFKVISKSYSENMEGDGFNKGVNASSQFFLECLGFLPSEFWGFAADVLLSGMRPVIKDSPCAILLECSQPEQRQMLHHIGLSLGIAEWTNNSPDIASEVAETDSSTGDRHLKNAFNRPPSSEEIFHDKEDDHNTQSSHEVDTAEVSVDATSFKGKEQSTEVNKNKNAESIIMSIRRDEFGLDQNLSDSDSVILKKQHARLGRALHCLSHELYSQDSHFLLELVQNADDNIYTGTVKPTLAFILHKSGIIVLNNEEGFSGENIRALCDVGNSTKKGSGAGYIGKKGIGFKSVFRVTDAPEIHSNGFHVKFDIGEGQIGFVLPTLVPSCDIESYSSLVDKDNNEFASDCWNTCIVLPFRKKLTEETAMNTVVTMFSDLNPSLLLFLHRLQCIKFRNMLDDSFLVMRKEIVGDGIIRVSCGEQQMTWFVASQRLQSDVIRRDVQTTEISIAFTLQEADDKTYIPFLELQPVFAFLPLRTYGLKFILQGDFVLPSSREEVDGDSPWNQWLLSEFPGLFVNGERSFCALPCFRENLGKAVAAYLSFIPLVGEVHGFFSSLPRMIISRLRMSNCLLLDGEDSNFVPPCKVLRGWNKQARILLSDSLLREHLGCGFLHRDIVLSDSLARALGIEEYGPRVLLQILISLCCKDNGLKSMGLSWLASFLDAFYTMILQSSELNQTHSGFERDLLDNLQKISFIPLSDGTYSCISKGTIWLHSDALNAGETGLDAFPGLSATLRTVSPALLAAPSLDDVSPIDMNLTDGISRMLYRIGVQQLSAHGIIKHHILPAISDDQILNKGKDLILDYLCFVMIHLQFSCTNCRTERGFIISELQTKAVLLTNHGFKRPIETSIHFSKEFGNPLDMNKLVDDIDMEWHQVDTAYLNHPAMQSLSSRLSSWRGFLQEMGITDFVKVIQVDKRIGDMPHSVCKDLMLDNGLNSPDSVAKDWESSELVSLLSLLSVSGNQERSKYLLEILDSVWDECFSDKTTGHCSFGSDGSSKTFRSSFISKISDIPWVVSSMDNKLHYPKDLFHGSDAVISLLGDSAPYVVPKVRSEHLLAHIGFKTKVTLDDILDILKVWRRLETPFKASIEQMSRLYTFIWNEMAVSRHKIAEVFESGPFIFVPFATGARVDLVSGAFMPSKEVYWQDSTGATDHVKNLNFSGALGPNQYPLCSTLCNIYPGLHQFFVRGCGVNEIPPFQCHLRVLQQLATASLPCQAASVVFQVFLKWNEELKCGSLTSRDTNHLKESLVKLDYTVLPTVQDKWVSLHSSYGLVCWCDDKKLKKRFKHLDNISFLYFGERSGKEQMLRTKVSLLMQSLGIPALSDVVTRKAIHHGSANSSSKVSLVKWALPFAQRYMYSLHTDKYLKLKQSGFNDLSKLRIVVVEKLFYKNVIKRCGGASSKKQFECSCLLQDNVLYSTQESDSHSLFLELSRLFFDGTPELQLANFLLMITKMAETGSSEEQIGLFILNSQKVRKLPDNEDVWSISSASSVTENQRCTSEGDELNNKSSAPKTPNEQILSNPKSKGKVSSWPPGDWKTAPDFSYARASGFVTWGTKPSSGNSSEKKEEDGATALLTNDEDQTVILTDVAASSTASVVLNSENMEDKSIINALHDMQSRNDNIRDSSDITPGSVIRQRDRDSLITSTPDAAQAQLTGRAGEQVAYMYMSGLFGKEAVKWVNEENETGLPYDLVVDKGNNSCEYIEVKATRSAKKDWFEISTREWQFAADNGESFSILHVVLGSHAAKISKFENPFRLCQHRKLQLVVMMTPKDHS